MAATASSFQEYAQSTVDPYAHDPSALLTAFDPADLNITAAVCLAQSESDDYPLMFLTGDNATHQPLLLCAPFRVVAPGLLAAPREVRYAYCGDVVNGNPAPLVEVLANSFDITAHNEFAHPAANLAAAWANPAHANLATLPAVTGADQAVVMRTRRMMPVPHGFVAPLLAAHQAGILTWRWISTNVVTPILADPLQAQALALFLAHIGVASTDRAASFPRHRTYLQRDLQQPSGLRSCLASRPPLPSRVGPARRFTGPVDPLCQPN